MGRQRRPLHCRPDDEYRRTRPGAGPPATRGAVHAVDDAAAGLDHVTHEAVLGTLRALHELRASPVGLRGAAYGALQGALEAGHNLAAATGAAMAAAQAAAPELGITEAEASAAAADGIMAAAYALDDLDLQIVVNALPEGVREQVEETTT